MSGPTASCNHVTIADVLLPSICLPPEAVTSLIFARSITDAYLVPAAGTVGTDAELGVYLFVAGGPVFRFQAGSTM